MRRLRLKISKNQTDAIKKAIDIYLTERKKGIAIGNYEEKVTLHNSYLYISYLNFADFLYFLNPDDLNEIEITRLIKVTQ